MVATIHETVDDDVHERLNEWRNALDMTWREFFNHLANDVAPTTDEVEG